MDIRFKNTETYIKSFAETKLIKYFLESYQASRQRTGGINAPVKSSGDGGSSLNVKVENGGLDINLYGNAYLQGVDEGTKPFSPPPDAIINWLQTKPVEIKDYKTGKLLDRTPANLRSVAYKIGDSIRADGIAPASYIREVVEKAFNNIVDGMLPPLKEDITDKLDEILTSVGYTKKGDTYVLKGK